MIEEEVVEYFLRNMYTTAELEISKRENQELMIQLKEQKEITIQQTRMHTITVDSKQKEQTHLNPLQQIAKSKPTQELASKWLNYLPKSDKNDKIKASLSNINGKNQHNPQKKQKKHNLLTEISKHHDISSKRLFFHTITPIKLNPKEQIKEEQQLTVSTVANQQIKQKPNKQNNNQLPLYQRVSQELNKKAERVNKLKQQLENSTPQPKQRKNASSLDFDHQKLKLEYEKYNDIVTKKLQNANIQQSFSPNIKNRSTHERRKLGKTQSMEEIHLDNVIMKHNSSPGFVDQDGQLYYVFQ